GSLDGSGVESASAELARLDRVLTILVDEGCQSRASSREDAVGLDGSNCRPPHARRDCAGLQPLGVGPSNASRGRCDEASAGNRARGASGRPAADLHKAGDRAHAARRPDAGDAGAVETCTELVGLLPFSTTPTEGNVDAIAPTRALRARARGCAGSAGDAR